MAKAEETKVRVKLPKLGAGEENYRIVGVNGKLYKIQRGIWVDVPEAVAEILDSSDAMIEKAEEFYEKNSH